MRKLPEGVLNISTSRRTPTVQPSRSQTHQPPPQDADTSLGQQTISQQESEDTAGLRERIVDKWNSLKMFFCRRLDAIRENAKHHRNMCWDEIERRQEL